MEGNKGFSDVDYRYGLSTFVLPVFFRVNTVSIIIVIANVLIPVLLRQPDRKHVTNIATNSR
jgi:hypothetical protein